MLNATYNDEKPPREEKGTSIAMGKFARIVCLFAPGDGESFL